MIDLNEVNNEIQNSYATLKEHAEAKNEFGRFGPNNYLQQAVVEYIGSLSLNQTEELVTILIQDELDYVDDNLGDIDADLTDRYGHFTTVNEFLSTEDITLENIATEISKSDPEQEIYSTFTRAMDIKQVLDATASPLFTSAAVIYSLTSENEVSLELALTAITARYNQHIARQELMNSQEKILIKYGETLAEVADIREQVSGVSTKLEELTTTVNGLPGAPDLSPYALTETVGDLPDDIASLEFRFKDFEKKAKTFVNGTDLARITNDIADIKNDTGEFADRLKTSEESIRTEMEDLTTSITTTVEERLSHYDQRIEEAKNTVQTTKPIPGPRRGKKSAFTRVTS